MLMKKIANGIRNKDVLDSVRYLCFILHQIDRYSLTYLKPLAASERTGDLLIDKTQVIRGGAGIVISWVRSDVLQ